MTSAVGKGSGHDPALLFISQEPYLLKEREEEVRDRLIPAGSRDLNLLVLYGWEADADAVVEFLQTMPFLAECRLLILREVHALKDHGPILDYLRNPNPSSCLLMTSSEMKKTDARYRAISSLSKAGELRKPSGPALVRWVERRFETSGKSIDPALSEVLVQVAGADMAILASEIGKVVASSGQDEKITHDDVSVSVPGGVEAVFGLLDALGEGDRERAMAALKNLIEYDHPPEYLVHMMAWHYRQLLRGLDLVDSGMDPLQAAERMGKRYGLKDKFARHLGRATGEGLIGAMRSLSRCDLSLKGSRVPPEILLDRLVLDLLRSGKGVDFPGEP